MTYRKSPKFAEFKNHFLNSPLAEQIINDQKITPILMYITGSTLTNCADSSSDYDLCLLSLDIPKHLEEYRRPPKWYAQYLPEGRKCQIIYNDFSNIFTVSIFPQDNVGWAQFKYATEDCIFYLNPQYRQEIQMLFSHKDEISRNALYLFGISCQSALAISSIEDITDNHLQSIPKLAYQLAWAGAEAAGTDTSLDFLVRLKHQPFLQLTEDTRNQLRTLIKAFAQYVETYSKSETIKELEKFYGI